MTDAKSSLRAKLLNQRKALTPLEILDLSSKVCQRIIESPFIEHQHFGLYESHFGEIDLSKLKDHLITHHKLGYYPCIVKASHPYLEYRAYNQKQESMVNAYNIKEPKSGDSIDTSLIEVLLIPLVGVDLRGNRLGMGKGFFDRTLGKLNNRPILIGVAYDFQICETLPTDNWDIPMDYIITPTQMITCIPK